MMFSVWKSQLKRKHFYLNHDDPRLFVRSQWQESAKPHLLYLIYRWALTIFFVITWIFSIVDIPNLNQPTVFKAKWLIYLTNWAFTMCFVQSCLCSIMLTIYYFSATHEAESNDEEIKPTPVPKFAKLYKLYWIGNIVATDVAFAVTIIYWSLIYNDKEAALNAMNIIVHGMNSFLMLLDLLIVAHPVRILHFYIPVLFGFLYVIFSIIYYAVGGTNKKEQVYIYTILNWTNPGKTVLVCLGVTVFLILLHFFTYGMYRLRMTISEQLQAKRKEEKIKLQLNCKSSSNNGVTSSTDLV